MNTKERLHSNLRSGLTTGTCACAVAKASAYMLVNNCVINHIAVKLPQGNEVILELQDVFISNEYTECSTIKDAGDDPDITHGAKITAKAIKTTTLGIQIKAGKGIGTVTKPGLSVKIGEAAINPTPLKMIKEALNEVVPKDLGVKVLLSIPNGETLAKKTFNPKLGIVGGLSILGTTGIVKPMSEEALKDSLVLKLKQLASLGKTKAILSPGNYGKAFSKQQFNYDEEKTVLTSNYIGFMLEQAVRHKFQQLVLVGHIGKLVKLAGGIFQTHSRTADARNEILAAHYFKFTSDAAGFKQIIRANTTEEVASEINNTAFWNHLAVLIKARAEQYIFNELQVEVVLFSQQNGLLSSTPEAFELVKEISEND